jgi:hypothetical protein
MCKKIYILCKDSNGSHGRVVSVSGFELIGLGFESRVKFKVLRYQMIPFPSLLRFPSQVPTLAMAILTHGGPKWSKNGVTHENVIKGVLTLLITHYKKN